MKNSEYKLYEYVTWMDTERNIMFGIVQDIQETITGYTYQLSTVLGGSATVAEPKLTRISKEIYRYVQNDIGVIKYMSEGAI